MFYSTSVLNSPSASNFRSGTQSSRAGHATEVIARFIYDELRTHMTIAEVAIAVVCLGLGGMLKGATGAGAPILAVPALATMFNVQFAVVIMLVPNLLTNCWQAWRFRRSRLPASFIASFTLAGAAGVVAGSLVLAHLSPRLLSLLVAVAVASYVGFRLLRPNWMIPFRLARLLSAPAGLLAGALQGASGMSAPASLSFLNALRLERPVFISTVSFFFLSMSLLQIPTLTALGVLDAHQLLLSSLALGPIVLCMPLGARLALRLPQRLFDRLILILLSALALKLLLDAFH